VYGEVNRVGSMRGEFSGRVAASGTHHENLYVRVNRFSSRNSLKRKGI
jgi:hypothetical protein